MILDRNVGKLGLSIIGGSEHASRVFGGGRPGVYVSKVSCISTVPYMYMCVCFMIVHIDHAHLNMYTCTLDAWAFKGTATGYISHVPQRRLRSSTVKSYNCALALGSLVSVQISRTTMYPVVSDY